jgi:hypothetical protein
MIFLLKKRFYLLIVILTLLIGCSSTPKPPPPLVLSVRANAQANNGELFYFVVKTANEKQFMLETYQDVASKAFSDPPDPAGLGVFSIVPGTKQEYNVNQPAEGTIALYFLFTKPGSQWKKLLAMPFEEEYIINLKATGQVDIERDKPWYDFFEKIND